MYRPMQSSNYMLMLALSGLHVLRVIQYQQPAPAAWDFKRLWLLPNMFAVQYFVCRALPSNYVHLLITNI